jgi:hypothetical protein
MINGNACFAYFNKIGGIPWNDASGRLRPQLAAHGDIPMRRRMHPIRGDKIWTASARMQP